MGFRRDLNFGQKYENISTTFTGFDRIVLAPNKPQSYWDYYTVKGDKKICYEVKADRLAHRTGNLVIEFQCNKKPSGLTATKADYWYYFVVDNNGNYDVYKFPVDELKELVIKENCQKINGGNGYRSKMYVLKKDKCDKYLFKPENKLDINKFNYSVVLSSIDRLRTFK
jgi:hypothetical protein